MKFQVSWDFSISMKRLALLSLCLLELLTRIYTFIWLSSLLHPATYKLLLFILKLKQWHKIAVQKWMNESKDIVFNKLCSFEFSIHQSILNKRITVSTKILSSTAVFNIDNNKQCCLSTKSSYVTLDHKTSYKGQFVEIIEIWINKLFIDMVC